VSLVLAAIALAWLYSAYRGESGVVLDVPVAANDEDEASSVDFERSLSSRRASTASSLQDEPVPPIELEAELDPSVSGGNRVPRYSPLVTVVVQDDESNRLAGARVEITSVPIEVSGTGEADQLYMRRGVTDGSGEVSFRIEPREVSALLRDVDVGVHVQANCFETAYDWRICNLREDLRFEITLERANTMGGLVLSDDGQPIKGAIVAAIDSTGKVFDRASSREDGQFFFEGEKGVVPLAVVGYHASFGWGRLPVGFVRDDAHDYLGEVRLVAGASLEGIIENSSGKRYVDTPFRVERVRRPGGDQQVPMSVTESWMWGWEDWRLPDILDHSGLSEYGARTDSEGRFSVSGLLQGKYWISLEEWSEQGGSSLRFPYKMRGLGPFRTGTTHRVVVDAYQVRVSVVDHEGGAIPQAYVSVISGNTSTMGTIANTSACYSVPPGELTVIASVLDYTISGETIIDIREPGITYDAVVVLDTSSIADCTGSITVVMDVGSCTSDDTFQWRLASHSSREHAKDFSSHTIDSTPAAPTVVPELMPGAYVVDQVSVGGHHFNSTENVTVVCDQDTEVEFAPTCGGRLKVKIRSEGETLNEMEFGVHVRGMDEDGIPVEWDPEHVAVNLGVGGTLVGESALLEPSEYYVQVFRLNGGEWGGYVSAQFVHIEPHVTANVEFDLYGQ